MRKILTRIQFIRAYIEWCEVNKLPIRYKYLGNNIDWFIESNYPTAESIWWCRESKTINITFQ